MILQKATNQDFELVYKNYMIEQFPANELKSYDEFVSLLTDIDKSYHMYLVKDSDSLVGYTLFYVDDRRNFLWIDYLAVLPDSYSKGYGRRILAELKNNFSKYRRIYFEVEKPVEEKPNTIRRVCFYESCGCQKLDCEYYFPNKDGCLPMDLYALEIDDSSSSKKDILSDIYSAFSALHSQYPHIESVFAKIN